MQKLSNFFLKDQSIIKASCKLSIASFLSTIVFALILVFVVSDEAPEKLGAFNVPFITIVLMPLIETMIMFVIVLLIRSLTTNPTIQIFVCALTLSALHFSSAPGHAFMVFIPFILLSLPLVHFWESHCLRGFSIAFLSHSLSNTFAFGISGLM
ncbi:MAG: hypothetical protein CMF07_04075 [Idiomarina sp.]|nr:hypothetical protein [Idiomarina sp.]|tara:strand:+ start:6989 stop:7450 length:462 start_codon:yes stop_codon:yes gene_type:complete